MGRYVSSYFSPGRNAQDQIIGFISRCQRSLDIAVYSITNSDIVDAIEAAAKRGVKFRILTDKVQASSRYALDERLEAMEGVALRRDKVSGSMHNKFMVADAECAERAIFTGSYNWTTSAEDRNAENFVVIRLSYTVAEYQNEFNNLWQLAE